MVLYNRQLVGVYVGYGLVRVQEWENCIPLTLPSPIKGEGTLALIALL